MDWPATLPKPLMGARVATDSRSWRTEMETGRVRQRRVQLLPLRLVQAEWSFTGDAFETFKEFFEVSLENGSLPFALELFGADSEESEVAFMGPYSWSRSDNLFSVSAVLEVLS